MTAEISSRHWYRNPGRIRLPKSLIRVGTEIRGASITRELQFSPDEKIGAGHPDLQIAYRSKILNAGEPEPIWMSDSALVDDSPRSILRLVERAQRVGALYRQQTLLQVIGHHYGRLTIYLAVDYGASIAGCGEVGCSVVRALFQHEYGLELPTGEAVVEDCRPGLSC